MYTAVLLHFFSEDTEFVKAKIAETAEFAEFAKTAELAEFAEFGFLLRFFLNIGIKSDSCCFV